MSGSSCYKKTVKQHCSYTYVAVVCISEYYSEKYRLLTNSRLDTMADLVKRQKIIEIKGESYVLDEIPSENSGVVMAEKEKLLGVIDLKTLVDDLGRVGGFIRIAYNGVGAAGYEHNDEQMEIQKIGYDIAHLCNKSALTIAKFKKA